jgi:predicted nucleotidyltransferase
MIRFKQFILEAITDDERETLSKQIFSVVEPQSKAKLHTKVISQIDAGLKEIEKLAPVIEYVLMGSILTLRYTDEADLDILVLIDTNENKLDAIRKKINNINEKLVSGTEHPVNYFVVSDKKDYQRRSKIGDGVFDIKNNKFIRIPDNKPFDVGVYWQEFLDSVGDIDKLKSELKRDLIDYKKLKQSKKSGVKYIRQKLQDKLQELEDGANDLVDLYDKIKQDRRDAFNKDLSDKEIKKYGESNRLPENVIYKLLERYHYLTFLKQVDEILGDDKELSPEEAKELAAYLLKKT